MSRTPVSLAMRGLIAELEYKLGRILEFKKRKPNHFRHHIIDIKNYLIAELNEE